MGQVFQPQNPGTYPGFLFLRFWDLKICKYPNKSSILVKSLQSLSIFWSGLQKVPIWQIFQPKIANFVHFWKPETRHRYPSFLKSKPETRFFKTWPGFAITTSDAKKIPARWHWCCGLALSRTSSNGGRQQQHQSTRRSPSSSSVVWGEEIWNQPLYYTTHHVCFRLSGS